MRRAITKVRRVMVAFVMLVGPLVSGTPARAIQIEQVTSPNGIKAWLVQDHSLAVVSVDFAFRGGAALDPAGKEGLATLALDLLDEGAGDLDSSAYQGRVEDLASTVEFSASEDMVAGTLRTISANVTPAFDLLHLALTNPRFDEAAVARVRGQLIAALAHEAHEPNFIAQKLWWQTAFEGHPYAKAVRGTPESVAHIETSDLKAFVGSRFARNALLIAVVGDIAPDMLGKLLDRTFGDLPAQGGDTALPEVSPHASDAVMLEKLPIPQSVVTFGQPGLKRSDPDWYAALVVNHVLGGGGLTSRLAEEVREKRGLAYGVTTGLHPLDAGGVIIGSVATENAHVAQTIEIIRSEWARMRDNGPSDVELRNAKTYLTGSFPLGLDSTGSIARTLVSVQFDRLGIDYLSHRAELIERVNVTDAKRVARRLFNPDALSFVVVGEPDNLANARSVPAGVHVD